LLNKFWAADEPRELASEINSTLKASIDDKARQTGKKFRHACNYAMGKYEASIQAGISEAEAARLLDAVHNANPNIRGVFHKEIQDALRMNGNILTNPNGRQRLFMNRWGPELFKEAYASIPQGVVSDQTKKAAMSCERRIDSLQILAESHDSFLAQLPTEDLDEAIPIIREEMESEIDFAKCSLPRGKLSIPCEIKIGERNWEEMRAI
jgi:DNA polymerase I-like protein with 3'-5' exonuclease and polymerase domains